MRATIIFCLTLFFLLFKGNNGVHAVAPRLSQGYEFFNENPQTKQHHTPFHKNANLHIQKSVSARELNYAEESQDEDERISKKGILSLQITYFCYSFLLGNLRSAQKLALPYCEHLSYTSSIKYLLLRVFRI